MPTTTSPRKTEPHLAYTPGWLSRSVLPIANRPAARLQSVAASFPLVARLSNYPTGFVLARTMAFGRYDMSAAIANQVGSFRSIMHPWHRVASLDLWVGRVPRMLYRAKPHAQEARLANATRPRSMLRQSLEPTSRDDYAPAVSELDIDQASELSAQAHADPQYADITTLREEMSITSPLMPLSLPVEWLGITQAAQAPIVTSTGAPAVQRTFAMARAVRASSRMAPTGSTSVFSTTRAHGQRQTFAPVSDSPEPAPGVSSQIAIEVQPRERTDSGEFSSARISSSMSDSLGIESSADKRRPIGASRSVRRMEAGAESAYRSQPAWPFQLLEPIASAVTARVDAVLSTPLSSRAASFLALARRQMSLRPDASGATVAGVASQARVRPLEYMLKRVPLSELAMEEGAIAPSTTDWPAYIADSFDTPTGAPSGERGSRAPFLQRSDSAVVARAARRMDARPEQGTANMDRVSRRIAAALDLVGAQSIKDWPVLEAARHMTVIAPSAMETAGMQTLRRVSANRPESPLGILTSLPSLGRGEPLPEQVRRPMETLLGRSFSAVRTFTSPVAEALGAEAFTSGERIVFAPGRMDYSSPRGLALVGHELSHIGQALAFKESTTPAAGDASEDIAMRQEAQIERIIAQGWPDAPHMEVLQASQALRTLVRHGGGGGAGETETPPGRATPTPAEIAGAAAAPQTAAPAGGTYGAVDPLPSARLSAVAPAGAAAAGNAPAPHEMDKLAREVYEILKARLRAERTRHQVY